VRGCVHLEVVLACSPIAHGRPNGDRRVKIGYMMSLSTDAATRRRR